MAGLNCARTNLPIPGSVSRRRYVEVVDHGVEVFGSDGTSLAFTAYAAVYCSQECAALHLVQMLDGGPLRDGNALRLVVNTPCKPQPTDEEPF